MPASDSITVTFKTEGGETVEETFKRVAAASDQFHQKVTRASSALGDLKLKSESRIAGNIGAVAQSLTSGAGAAEVFATAITRATESFRGSVLFASAATVGFSLYQGVTRAGEAVIRLNEDIADLHRASLVPGDFLGTDRINKNLDTALGRVAELEQKIASAKFFGNAATGVGNLLGPLLPGVSGAAGAGGVVANLLGRFEKSKLDEVRKEGVRTLDQLTEKQLTLNTATFEGLSGDEKKAELLKVQADHLERAFKISELESRLGITGTTAAQSGETSRLNLENTAIEKKYRLEERQLDLQRDIVRTEKELLLPSEQNFRILDLRIGAINKLLNGERFLTQQEREQAQIQKGQLEVQRDRAQRDFFGSTNPGQFAFAKLMEEERKKVFDEQKADFLKHETLRRSGLEKDVRDPFVKEFEELSFGKAKQAGSGSLAGQDFSGIASLAGLDYSGIRSLADFPTIKIY